MTNEIPVQGGGRAGWMGMKAWRHWTLRSRLVLVVGALAAIALIIANITGLVLIRSYLRDRIDQQLLGMTRPFSNVNAGLRFRLPRLGPDQVAYLLNADGSLD